MVVIPADSKKEHLMDVMPGHDVYADYQEAVERLLSLGPIGSYDPASWPDYVAEYGISVDDVPALTRMACDPALDHAGGDGFHVWTPVHAWRALGQLRAETAIDLSLAALARGDDDYGDVEQEVVPYVLGLIGPAAIAPLVGFLAGEGRQMWQRIAALTAIKEVGKQYATCRNESIDILARMLQPGPPADAHVLGFAVSDLIDLGAIETIDAIRDAYRRDVVDISVCGDIEDVEIALGLRDVRATPKPFYTPWGIGMPQQVAIGASSPQIVAAPRRAAVGRNEPCPCGSGKKYKKCCL
jgi:hypothetical protein